MRKPTHKYEYLPFRKCAICEVERTVNLFAKDEDICELCVLEDEEPPPVEEPGPQLKLNLPVTATGRKTIDKEFHFHLKCEVCGMFVHYTERYAAGMCGDCWPASERIGLEKIWRQYNKQ